MVMPSFFFIVLVTDRHVGVVAEASTPSSLPPHPLAATDQTQLTAQLNAQIRRGDNGVFTGGKGILVRNPLDGYEDMPWSVVPATFWVNDIFTSSQLYVTAVANNVDCPNDGTNGYYNLQGCSSDPNDSSVTGGWDYAAMAYVIGTQMHQVMADYDNIQSQDWGYGVFYPSDSNGVDQRCHRLGSNDGYDCPGGILYDDGTFADSKAHLGAGGYPAGNPYVDDSWGGGTGCHFDMRTKLIDQTDAYNPVTGQNLVNDNNCQCDYGWKTGDDFDWGNFVDNWVQNAAPKKGEEGVDPWFAGGKAPNRALDLVSCWVNNPRDMIHLQNQLWWKREDWSNQMAPKSNWNLDPSSHRVYWGWNEVPIANAQAGERSLRDAVIIRLPAAICGGKGDADSPACLSHSAQLWLETDIDDWVNKGHLHLGRDQVGKTSGSNLVWVRAVVDSSGNWGQEFFCESWSSPSRKYKVVFDTNSVGECYIDKFTAPAEFQVITTGKCADIGQAPIDDEAFCEQAAASLGFTYSRISTTTNKPEGCYVNANNGDVFLATNQANIGNGAMGSDYPICVPAKKFQVITTGKCADIAHAPIDAEALCKQAAASLGFTYSRISTTTNKPEGCYVNANNGDVFLATNKANIGNGAIANEHPICQEGAQVKKVVTPAFV